MNTGRHRDDKREAVSPAPLARPTWRRAAWILAMVLCLAPGSAAADDAELWAAFRSEGHLALLRHALAPGTGDPADFELQDCGTQRNLSVQGRDQAGRIGDRFRASGVAAANVFSSQWCRCLETANLLGLGPVKPLPALNSFFERPQDRDEQTRALADWLAGQSLATTACFGHPPGQHHGPDRHLSRFR